MKPPSTTGEYANTTVRAYGSYLLIKKLAEGGMAEIFLAKQVGAEGFERNVVIKRMLKHLSAMPDFVTMFLDEARLAARLAHQNIVQINDLGLADECYYICMEYLAGEDFSTVLRRTARKREFVPLNVVLRIMIDAAHGLHFAHEFTDDTGRPLRIVHRDISPSNLFVTFGGQVKVLDFGIAKAETRVTATTGGVVKGKYMYMSPEQARGEIVDRRSDVFALGTTLFEALTNVRPFSRETDLGVLSALMQLDFKRPREIRPDLPADLEAVVLKAMTARVEDRFQTALEFATALEQFLGSSTSASGGAQVSLFMHSSFGEPHVLTKTRIPTLTSLAAAGVDVPGYGNPNAPKTDVLAAYQQSQSAAAGLPSVDVDLASPSTRKPKMALLGLGVAVLLGVVGTSAWLLTRAQPPPPASVPVAVPVVVAPPVVPPVVTPVVVDAGVAAIAATVPVVVDPPKVTQVPVKRKGLSSIEIQKVLSRHRPAIMSCFDAHKAELPSDSGQVMVNFTILGSGKVSEASIEGALAGSSTGRCVSQQVKKIRFSAHNEKDISLALPLSYRVQR